MRKSKFLLLIAFLFYCAMVPKSAMAWACKNNGVLLPYNATVDLYIDPVADFQQDNYTEIINFKTFLECASANYNTFYDTVDAATDSINPKLLTSSDFYMTLKGTRYKGPTTFMKYGPGYGNTGLNQYYPMDIQLGIVPRYNPGSTEVIINKGELISVLKMHIVSTCCQQTYNYRVIAKSDFILPFKTCNVTNYDKVVALPTASSINIINNGTGRYPNATKGYSIDLDCNPGTNVSIKFDGTTMAGNSQVLANSSSGNPGVGIQVLFNNTPITFGSVIKIINNAQAQEKLPFDAYYYYNGNGITAGPVTALTTFTLTYN